MLLVVVVHGLGVRFFGVGAVMMVLFYFWGMVCISLVERLVLLEGMVLLILHNFG